MKTIFLVLLIIFSFIKAEINPDNVLLAINCGGPALTSSRGIEYVEDSYYEGGQSSDFGSQFEFKNTNDAILYHTERWSEKDIIYNLPINEGKFALILKFSEVYFTSLNEKVFDILIGKRKVVSNLDIFSKVGKSTAYDEYIEFEIKSSKVYVNNKVIEDGYNSDDKTLKLVFKKGERDNPKINAIMVVKGGLLNTDYEEYKASLEEMEKEKMEKERKQREIKKRNNLHYDFEEFEEDFVDDDLVASGISFSSIILLLVVLFGIYYTFFSSSKSLEKTD